MARRKNTDDIELAGLVVPVLTPFDDAGKVDRREFVRHLEFLAENGVRRIMVNGTTGEFFSLLPEERRLLLELACRHFTGAVVQHACGCGLKQTQIEIQWAAECGAAAVVVLPPIYPAGLEAEGVIGYLGELAATAEVPFILYNFPKHTGNALTAKILQAVPHYALKDSAQNLKLMEATPRYFVGSSTNIFEAVRQGGAGFVSATANVRPELYVDLEMALASARVDEAIVLQDEIRTFGTALGGGGIAELKQALAGELRGYPVNVRLPLA